MVFQNHSLLPWLTCFGNVYLAVESVFGADEGKASLQNRVHEVLQLVGLSEACDKLPHEISGGMKQRVGIARALSMQPKVLLLDEPFGALDALTRANLQDELMRIVDRHSEQTVIMVTHDVDEAVLLSDRIVMMTNGPGASIGEILTINIPRPRNRLQLVDNPVYVRLRGDVLKFLYGKMAA
jgi:nitrate/nitrite transport system ATP-binding protein